MTPPPGKQLGKFDPSPVYHGDYVNIQIGSSGHHHKLPKDLLCKKSAYFAHIFLRKHKEITVQAVTLKEIDGVLSDRAFAVFVEWLYRGYIVVNISPSLFDRTISDMIELARFTDTCHITGMEDLLAKHMTSVIIGGRQVNSQAGNKHPDANTRYITSANIVSASLLPAGHPVRKVLAKASVEGYLRCKARDYKFHKEAKEIPGFALDLLNAVDLTLREKAIGEEGKSMFRDPISRELVPFFDFEGSN